MKYQKDFVVPLLLAIIAILLVGGGAYIYVQERSQIENPTAENEVTSEAENTTTQTEDSPVRTIFGPIFGNVYIKDNGEFGEFLLTDISGKVWTVYYRGAIFSEYSASTGKARGTDGLLKTTLEDWLKIQKHVGDSVEVSGAPGTITISGSLSDDGVLIAKSIRVDGQ